MAEILYTGNSTTYPLYEYNILDTATVSVAREYIDDRVWVAGGVYENTTYHTITFSGSVTGGNALTEYDACYIQANGNIAGTTNFTSQQISYTESHEGGGSSITSSPSLQPSVNYSIDATKNASADIYTNIPIFAYEDYSHYQTYISNLATEDARNAALTHAINYKDPELLDEEETFEFTTIARSYTIDEFGNITENATPEEVYRGFRIKSKYRTSLYKIEGIDDGKLKYGINFHDATACYYSTDYGNTWQMVQGAPTTLPFNFTYRPYETADGTGITFVAAVGDGNNKNLFVFDNKEDSDEYNAGLSDGRKASNYNEVIGNGFSNPTGDDDEETEFGEVQTRGFFSQQYVMDSATLQALANDLFDTTAGGIWEDIKKGLDMYGANPMDAVMGLTFWPVDLTTVFPVTSAPYVWFGGYGWEPSGGNAYRLTYPNGYKSLGSVAIKKTFNNWRDWAPYTRLFISLPYVGKYELDLTKYYDKTVEVRYFFDTRTNGCIACLIADGHLMDYFNGQMGVTMPITLTDYSAYANSQIQTLLGFGGQTVSKGMGAASNASQLAAAGAGSAALGVAGVGIAGAAIGAKAVYGLSQNNINKFNQTKGGSSSMINEYLPQYVEFIFEIQEDCAPDNYGEQYGYPSMKSGTVGSFQGFLKCQSVKLNCGVATEQEKNQIKTMLLNGIYI